MQEAIFYFNEPQKECEAFSIRAEFYESKTGTKYFWENKSYQLTDNFKLEFDLGNLKHPAEYDVKLFFDEQLMYADKFIDNDSIPF